LTPSPVRTIIAKEVRDSFKSVWLIIFTGVYFLVIIGVPYIVQGVLAPVGGEFANLPSRFTVTIVDSIPVVPLVPLMLGALTIVGEREKGTMEHVLTLPVGKFEVYIGKFLGLSIASSIAVIAGFGLAALAAASQGGFGFDPGRYAVLIGLMISLTFIFSALGVLLSSLSRNKAFAVGICLFLYFWLAILYDPGLLVFSAIIFSGSAALFPLLATLANPIDVIRIMAVMSSQRAINMDAMGPTGANMIHLYGNAQAFDILAVTAALWFIIPFVLAATIFTRQDT